MLSDFEMSIYMNIAFFCIDFVTFQVGSCNLLPVLCYFWTCWFFRYLISKFFFQKSSIVCCYAHFSLACFFFLHDLILLCYVVNHTSIFLFFCDSVYIALCNNYIFIYLTCVPIQIHIYHEPPIFENWIFPTSKPTL